MHASSIFVYLGRSHEERKEGWEEGDGEVFLEKEEENQELEKKLDEQDDEKGEGEEVTKNCDEEDKEAEEDEGAQEEITEEGTETNNKEDVQRSYSQDDLR